MTGRERRLANASLTAQEHQPTAAVHRLAEQTPQRRQEIPAFDQHINHSTAAPPAGQERHRPGSSRQRAAVYRA
jgi:hypothetical protein